jgi:selenocysteine-specific elongation factor
VPRKLAGRGRPGGTGAGGLGESMSSLVIGTAGHVDHGKSALVRALTGVDPDRADGDPVSVDRISVDRLKEEQRRGITIDLGFAHTRVGDVEIAFVDVPGHERFVRNMLAGAGGFDAVLLVVAADESVKPQTREHAAICRLLGLERGVIALTKSDLVDADVLATVAQEIRAFVAGTFLERAPVVPVSARTGAGLEAVRAELAQLANGSRAIHVRETARLAVDRAFSAKGFGTVVTGTLVSGAIGEGDEIEVLPSRNRVRVRGVHVHNRAVARAIAPRRVAVNLGHVAVGEVRRGVTLATPETLAVTRRLDVAIELLDALPGVPPVRHGGRVRLHLATSEIGARLAIGATRAPGSAPDAWHAAGLGEPAVAIPAGGRAFARLRLDEAVAATRGDRFVLRAYSPATTIGGGVVLDPEPPARGLRRAHALARFVAIADPSEIAAARPPIAFLAEAAARGVTADDIVRRAGVSRAEADARLEAWSADGRGVRGADRLFDAAAVAAAETAVVAALTAAHRQEPDLDGVARESLRTRMSRAAAPAWFDLVVGRLAGRGLVTGRERLSLSSHQARIEPGETRTRHVVEEALRNAGLTPPDVAALATATALVPAVVDRAIAALVRERRLVRVGDLVFHADALATLKAAVGRQAAVGRAAGNPTRLDVAAFKSQFGLTRKYAIPLLEWLDRERVTRRVGESRIVL